MTASDLLFYIPPVIFSIVAVAFLLIWKMKVAPAWQWGAGFAQTAAGFVVSTFLEEPRLAAFVSGMIFIGASYCYGSGLLMHFGAPRLRKERLTFVAVYTVLIPLRSDPAAQVSRSLGIRRFSEATTPRLSLP